MERHRDHFPDDTPDAVWLAAVAKHGWVILTHDRRIRHRAAERAAVMEHGVALIVVVGKARHRELAESFVRTQRRIAAFVAKHGPPYIAKVYRATPGELARNAKAPGSIVMWETGAT